MMRKWLFILYLSVSVAPQRFLGAEPERPFMNQTDAIPTAPVTTKPVDHRAPVPSEAARAASLSSVRQIYKDEFSGAGTVARKSEFARQLATQADITNDPADRWVLFAEALRLATEAGDTTTAIALIDRIPAEYAVERTSSRLEALSRLAPKVGPAQAGEVARRCLDLARDLEDLRDPDEMQRALTLALLASKKSKNGDLLAEATRLSIKQKERQKVEKDLEPILAKLASAADDADLCLEAGKILCFRADRWREGLPLLQKGSDEQLARIARSEMIAANSPAEHIRLGDVWWDWADTQKSTIKMAAQMAASRHYSSALPQVDGLERTRLEKRINSIAAASGGTGETFPLASVPAVEVMGAGNGTSKDGTFNGKAFTCGGKKYPAAVFTHPSDNATAKIAFRLPAGVRRLRGTVGVFSLSDTPAAQQPGSPIVMSIVSDGEVVWASPQLTKRDQSVAFDADLRGCVRLELHTTSLGSATTSWGAWLDPVLVK